VRLAARRLLLLLLLLHERRPQLHATLVTLLAAAVALRLTRCGVRRGGGPGLDALGSRWLLLLLHRRPHRVHALVVAVEPAAAMRRRAARSTGLLAVGTGSGGRTCSGGGGPHVRAAAEPVAVVEAVAVVALEVAVRLRRGPTRAAGAARVAAVAMAAAPPMVRRHVRNVRAWSASVRGRHRLRHGNLI
jgi:hypothetical protein